MSNQDNLITLPNGIKVTPQEWEEMIDDAVASGQVTRSKGSIWAAQPTISPVIITRVEKRGCFG